MKRIGKYFFEGLIILVPVVASIYIVYAVFVSVDGLLGIPVPGAGFAATLLLITMIGFLANNFLTKRLIHYMERLFTRLPLVKILYTSIKDLIGAFVGEKKSFDRPVLVQFPGGEARAIGFITRENLKFLGLTNHVAVYFPQSYNFAGNLFVYPTDRVQPLDAESAEVMAFLVSGGISGGKAEGT
jgi:uncharacterized membrane protein